MKAASRPVARRYARALLDVVTRKGQAPAKDIEDLLPEPEQGADQLANELRDSVSLLEQVPELGRALRDPLLGASRKKELVEAVWTKAGATPLLLRLLALLAAHGRLDLLGEIEEEFRRALLAERGVLEAEAVAATELPAAQREALSAALAGLSGREVDLRARQDGRLIGGVLVRMAGKSYDGTVRGRLRALKSRLVYGT
jgi:F-type H+-transporting ATPase subunit delta